MDKKHNIIEAVVEGLSGKAALREQITVLKGALEQSRADAHLLKALETARVAERDEWKRQNAALQEQLDKLFIVIQKDELEREVWQDELRQERERREQMERVNQQLGTRCDDLSLALERTRLLYNGQLEKVKQADLDKVRLQEQLNRKVGDCTRLQEERDSLQDRCDVLQGQLQQASAIIERYASIPWVKVASQSMSLLAELYEARIKKGSVKFWDMRYLDLKAQYDQLAPVEAEEAKENINAE